MITEYARAIDCRCSRRSYLQEPLTGEKSSLLRKNMAMYNEESGLSIRLMENDDLMQGPRGGMFSGVLHYFAMIGKKDDPDLFVKAGYFGERLVLDATLLGLGTCWVAGTYQKSACEKKAGLKEEEKLVCIITVGEVSDQKTWKEGLIHHLAKRRTKEVKEMLKAAAEAPQWVITAMEAVQKAPSAMNRQPVTFSYRDKTVTATVPDSKSVQGFDLGIALLHFEVGAGGKARFRRVGSTYQLFE